MKEFKTPIKKFFDFEQISENEMIIYAPIFMLDTPQTYSIRIKKVEDDYFLHDMGSVCNFINEYNLVIDKEQILDLNKRFPNLKFGEDNVITYKSSKKTINFDLAKFIQIITLLLG